MTGWLGGCVAALDTEATGLNVESARVVTACLGTSWGPGDWEPREWQINPGVPIPAEALDAAGRVQMPAWLLRAHKPA